MKRLVFLCSTGLWLGLLANTVCAQDEPSATPIQPVGGKCNCCPAPAWPGCPAPTTPGMPSTPGMPGTPQTPGTPTTPTTPSEQTPETAAQSPEAGSLAGATSDPGIFGDFIGPMGTRVLPLPSGGSSALASSISGNRVAVVAPVPYAGTFKISEDESPRPTDRAFFNYNYYDNVTKGSPYAAGTSGGNLDREEIGFEKTFLDGEASFGMRLPFLQLTGSTFDESEIGDLSLVFKYAFIDNRQTGNVLSGGLVLTLPTAPGIDIAGESEIRSVYFQPYVGYIYHFNRDLFFQGFTSLAVPTDDRDITLLFNSFALGYYAYRNPCKDEWLTSIVPVAELHLNTPLDHRGEDALPLGFPDALDATFGAYFTFHRASIGVAAGVPLTGPKPYDVEAIANLNISF